MRKDTFNYIRSMLNNYERIDQQIKERKEEIQFPYRLEDINSDIKSNTYNKDAMADYLIALESDNRINLLLKHQQIIGENLMECDEDTYTIINELYVKRYPRYRMDGLIQNQLVTCGRSKAYELRNEFFNNIANDLNLWT